MQLALLMRFKKLRSSDRDFASEWVIYFPEGHIIDAIKLRVELVALNVGIILCGESEDEVFTDGV